MLFLTVCALFFCALALMYNDDASDSIVYVRDGIEGSFSDTIAFAYAACPPFLLLLGVPISDTCLRTRLSLSAGKTAVLLCVPLSSSSTARLRPRLPQCQ